MQFNRYIFECYYKTDTAKESLDTFKYILSLKDLDIKDAHYKKEMSRLINNHYFTALQPNELEDLFDLSKGIYWFIENEIVFEDESLQTDDPITSIQQAEEFYEFFIDFWVDEIWRGNYRDCFIDIQAISTALFCHFPQFFLPYYFVNYFQILENIFYEFNIPLPKKPSKRNHRERLLYYFAINKELYLFRTKIGLQPDEMCAFLYDFTFHALDNELNGNLPEPKSVYITGATATDTKSFKNLTHDSIRYWAGNEKTLRGDIILVYSTAPHSAIKVICRAISNGYYDPLAYYPTKIWVGHPIIIPEISLTELKTNSIWREKGLVKANMQGVGGRHCTPEEYLAIHQILITKNFDVTLLPELLKIPLSDNSKNIENEKDVEDLLLEPLLERLGFKDSDWIRQMPLRMGRGERVYPDYALLPKLKQGEEMAIFIWEAKYRISSHLQLEYAFFQAKSYALRLGCIGIGLVSLEGIWISEKSTGFEFSKIVAYNWNELVDIETFTKLYQSASKEVLNVRRNKG